MFETFALRLAAGLVMALVILADREVHPRFYRIHWLIVLGLSGAAGVFAWDRAPEAFWLPFGLALATSAAGFWCWAVEELKVARWPVLIVGLITLFASLATKHFQTTRFADDLTAAAVLGLATTAMLMGHWYLIAPTMSLAPLLRLIRWMFVALGVRALVAGIELGLTSTTGELDKTAWLWLALRWSAGLVGPAILGWMAWQSARIRSTQSATGILYVVVIFVFIGELTDQLLQGHWAGVSA
jgi:hypothetical protein